MLYSALLVASAALSSFVSAQLELPPSIGPCCDVDPGTVNDTVKQTWCLAQRETCPAICGGYSRANSSCDAPTLQWTCVCSDGTRPNMSDYQQSVPGLMCRRWFDDCIAASGDNLGEQEACKAITCGNRTAVLGSASSSAASTPPATSTGGNDEPTNTASGAGQSSSPTGGANALLFARDYGTPLLAGGLAAVFGLAL
ncbi:hypothetical protein CC78DRAFT_531795 [Lojkania enalia]|uniref:DUF7707 domain-containing protein n=1 Tax=Lojkania enalia TaxID=147567 RepID=A0A9P4KD37_9PLEO|nr:hypothetical protein CC78DRAFT_531795 [Didymosphaeria enalia]